MQHVLTYWKKWRVFLIGAFSAILFAFQEYTSKPIEQQSVKVYLLAGFFALLSYISSQWRGQGVTLTGIIGILAGVAVQVYQTGNFTWFQFAVAALVGILGATAPPPKPTTYETNKEIVEAKEVPPLQQIADDSILPKSPLTKV